MSAIDDLHATLSFAVPDRTLCTRLGLFGMTTAGKPGGTRAYKRYRAKSSS